MMKWKLTTRQKKGWAKSIMEDGTGRGGFYGVFLN